MNQPIITEPKVCVTSDSNSTLYQSTLHMPQEMNMTSYDSSTIKEPDLIHPSVKKSRISTISDDEDIPLISIVTKSPIIKLEPSTPPQNIQSLDTKSSPKPSTIFEYEDEDDIPLVNLVKTKRKDISKDKIKKEPKIKSEKDISSIPETKSITKIKKEPKIKKEFINGISELTQCSQDTFTQDSEEYKWWLSQEADNSVKWQTLHHQGVYFPPEYVPHNIPMKYDNQEVYLEPYCEEIATFFASVIGTQYEQNKTFCENFFKDFLSALKGTQAAQIIKSFEKCDFTLISNHLNTLKEQKKTRTKEEKEMEKKEKDSIQEKYGICKIDERIEKVGNFRIEPPGLFRGRGEHPKTGCLKLRVKPEQITLNLSEDAPIPEPPTGTKWGNIVHDNTVTWLACWQENVNGDTKYVFLSAGSSLKGQSDMKKFEKARELKGHVDHIRQVNKKELEDDQLSISQRATALWLIDHLALRAGNEKGDDEADTVGCCSLRVEHIQLRKPSTIVFDFLGKDSIRYYNEVKVPSIIFNNLKKFISSKKKPDLIFDTLTTSSLNGYLTKLMPGLTAKVFRTFNASYTFQKELAGTPADGSVHEKILAYNRANRQVAVLCNHQRSVPKSHDASMEKLNDKLMGLKYERQLVRNELRKHKNTGELEDEWESDVDDQVMEKRKQIIETSESDVSQSSPKKKGLNNKSMEQLEKLFGSLKEKIAKLKTMIIDKDEGKQTALGTSKINYIDPRISVSWCKKYDVPIDKIFNKTLREKFKWAMEVDKKWKF